MGGNVTPPMEGSSSWKLNLGTLLLLTLIFFFNFMSRVILAPLMPTVAEDLSLGHADAGSLFLLIAFGYCMGLLASGFVSARFQHRGTIGISAVAVSGMLAAISLAHDLTWIKLWLVGLGLAAGIYLPSGIATLMIIVAARDWGKSIAIHEIAPNLAFVAAPILTEVLLNWCAWRGILAWIGAASVVAGLLFLALGRGGRFRGEVPNPANLRLLFAEAGFWIMVVLFGLGIGASLGVYNMLTLFLVAEHGFDRSWVNTLIAVSRIFCLGVALLAGWATDRIGPKRALLIVLVTTGVSTMLLGVLRGGWMIMAVFIQAMLAVCFFPAGFAALSIVVPVKLRNVAVSLAVPAGSLIGGGAIPAGIGILAQEGFFAFGFVMAGALIVVGSLLVGYLEAGTLRYDRGES